MTTSYSPLDVSEHPRGERRVHWSERLESVEELKELELTERGSDDDEEVEIYLQKSSSGSEEEQLDIEVDSPLFERLKSLAKLAAPVITSFFLSLGSVFINLFFAGQYSVEVFAGVSLANMFANISYVSLLVGMSGAVETLGSQLNGAGSHRMVGVVLQRSILILVSMSLPILAMWYYATSIFAFLGIEPAVCEVVGRYLRIRVLTMPLDCFSISYEKLLMSIGVVEPSLIASIWKIICLFFVDLYFVNHLKLGYECLAWAFIISEHVEGIIQFTMSLKYEEVKRTLAVMRECDWSKSTQEWWQFISLGLPGTAMLCSEWWAFEITVIMAGFLGTEEVAAQVIILQVASLAFMVPLGLGIAGCTIVGNSLGASKRPLAINMADLAIKSIVGLEFGVAAIIMLLGKWYVRLFTDDEDVLYHSDRMIPFLAFFTFIDGIQGVASGILRGCGKQFMGAVTNFIAFYIIGLPMSYLICFNMHVGANGLLMGIGFGTSFQVAILLYYIYRREDYMFTAAIKTEDAHLSDNDDSRDDDVAEDGKSSIQFVDNPMVADLTGAGDDSSSESCAKSNLRAATDVVSFPLTVDEESADV